MASWYGKKFHGRATASGEPFDMYADTAAHRSLPFGTRLEVTNLDNGRSVVVRVNDRGPFVKDRVLDLSYGAAKKLDYISRGTARVRVRVLSAGEASKSTGSRICIGNYEKRWKASRIFHFLRGRFNTARIESGGDGYQVVIGPFSSEHDRRLIAARLRREGYDIGCL